MHARPRSYVSFPVGRIGNLTGSGFRSLDIGRRSSKQAGRGDTRVHPARPHLDTERLAEDTSHTASGASPWRPVWDAVRDFQRAGRGRTRAALTYYAMLAFVPGMLAVIALIGLLGRHPQTTDALLDDVDRTGPESAVETFRGTIEGIITHTGGAGTLLIVGLISAIASATAWLDAFVRIAGDIHGSRVTDGFVRRKTRHAVTAIAYGLCLAVLGVLVVVTGPISARRGDAVGAGDATITARSTAKWPAALVLGVTMVAGLLGSPRAPPPPSRERSYGALGGVVVFLIWMWITHAALIVGLATADRLGGPRPG